MSKRVPTVVTPFRLPLSSDEFRAALQTGHGRALMNVLRHGSAGLEKLIVEACLHNQAYDPQCEDSRVDWLLDIIDAAGIQEAIQPQILKGWDSAPPDDYWDQSQLCGLAVAFARRGNVEFRRRLYAAYRKCPNSTEFIGAQEIVELDGVDGLLFVAERAGQWIKDHPQDYIWELPLFVYDERHTTGDAERILRAAASGNSSIATYLERMDALRAEDAAESQARPYGGTTESDAIARASTKDSPQPDAIDAWTAEGIIADVESSDRDRRVYRRWARQAPADQLEKIAERLYVENDPERIVLYLRMFVFKGLVRMDPRIMRFADSEDRTVRWVTYRVLANHNHPAVRELALDRVRAGRMTEGELGLLCENYEPGDWALIEKTIQLGEDADDVHTVTSDLGRVFEANRSQEAYAPLMFVYEYCPCGICRSDAVGVLWELGLAPDWVLEECDFAAEGRMRRVGETS